MRLLNLPHLLKLYKIYLIASVLIVSLVSLLLVGRQIWSLRFSPIFPVLDVEVSNLTDRSVTLSWLTMQPNVGTVRFLGEKSLTRENSREVGKLHYLTISGLQPQKAYYIYVTNSFGRKIVSVPFMTLPRPSEIKFPQTVYGKVVQSGKPSADSLVVLRRIILSTPQVQSESVSTLTNASGNYVLDLANAFLTNGSAPAGTPQRLEIRVWTKSGQFQENLFTNVQTQPFPDIAIGSLKN